MSFKIDTIHFTGDEMSFARGQSSAIMRFIAVPRKGAHPQPYSVFEASDEGKPLRMIKEPVFLEIDISGHLTIR